MKKILILITALLCMTPAALLAEGEAGTVAYHPDRILMLPSVSPKKTNKLVENVRNFSKKKFNISGEYAGIAILENSKTKDSVASLSSTPRFELCAKLKRSQRNKKIQNFKKRLKAITRDVTCSSDFEIYAADFIPNDPMLGSQKDVTTESSRNLEALKAWDYTVGSSDVVVGVVDTGVEYTHPDLVDNIWVNPHEIPGNNIDDDKNGYKDDVHGWDFANDDASPMDTAGHGTAVAGIIGASGNNNIGIAGINWNVKVLPLKVFFDSGKGYYSFILKAMDYCIKASDKGNRIVATNNSWGSSVPAGSDGGLSSLFSNTFDSFQKRNIMFVSAAGNAGGNSDKAPYVPASLFHPIILSVASIDMSGELSSFSNYGKNSIDIAAPGSQVFTTKLGGGYGYSGGTSMAAPHVSGAIALLASVTSDLNAQGVKKTIMDSGTALSSLSGKLVSEKTLNLLNIVSPYASPKRPGLRGDYDGNGAVDGGDFLAWQRQFGLVGPNLSADGNNDGKVDAEDLAVWKEEMAKLNPPKRGDYDNNGIVDGGDFMAWQRQFGATGANLSADGNKDGKVDGLDLEIWKEEMWKAQQSALPGDYNLNGIIDGGDFLTWQRQIGLAGCGNSADGNMDCIVDGKDLEIWKSAM